MTDTPPLRHIVALPPGMRLLTSNQRMHWRPKAKLTKEIREAACDAATRALVPNLARVHIIATLHPHDRRRRDPANWYPTFKAAVDGIVDAGVLDDDDHTRVVGPDMRLGEPVRGGRVVLELIELPDGAA